MLFCTQPSWNKSVKVDALVIPFWKFNGQAKVAVAEAEEYVSDYQAALDTFSGKLDEIELVYGNSKIQEKRLLLLGLGAIEELSPLGIFEAYARVTTMLRKARCQTVAILLPTISQLRVSAEDFLTSLASGVLTMNYECPKYLKDSSACLPLLSKVHVFGVVPQVASVLHKQERIFEGVFLTRDLVNRNADEITPEKLALIAKGLSQEFSSIVVEVLDKKAILKEKMGLLGAVAKGASVEPRLIVLNYQGKPKSKDLTVLVGKGVTFDSGGLDLKPGKAMLTMREDMAGAATVLGIFSAVASLELPINLVGIIPATENAIGSAAYKMGDVYIGMTGLSVEIGSTDAEGRLILADAISYALQYYEPTRIIDFATLTGAMVVSLGEEVAGFFSNNDLLAQDLVEASEATFEPIWRLPLVERYEKAIHSDIADVKNIGSNRAGAITAALFLRRFLENCSVDWAHFDIAGTAYREKEGDSYPKYASGFGVRFLVEYLENFVAK